MMTIQQAQSLINRAQAAQLAPPLQVGARLEDSGAVQRIQQLADILAEVTNGFQTVIRNVEGKG